MLRRASLRSAGVLAVCKLTAAAAAFALALVLAFAFALAEAPLPPLPLPVMMPTKASKEAPPAEELAVLGAPLVRAKQPDPFSGPPSIAPTVSAVVLIAALASMETPTRSRSVNLAPVVTQNLVELGSFGASGSATPSPRLITCSILVLGWIHRKEVSYRHIIIYCFVGSSQIVSCIYIYIKVSFMRKIMKHQLKHPIVIKGTGSYHGISFPLWLRVPLLAQAHPLGTVWSWDVSPRSPHSHLNWPRPATSSACPSTVKMDSGNLATWQLKKLSNLFPKILIG